MSNNLSPEDRERLEMLFENAVDLPPTEHAAFALRECGDQDSLRNELLRLLGGHAGPDRLGQLESITPLGPGTMIDSYRLLEKIGEGGMGEVYTAEQQHPVVRRVALKVIKTGMDSASILARFNAERQALARMLHPHIAQLYDSGSTSDHRPFFVMELVAGLPITEYCDQQKLTSQARLKLFLGVCEAVQHAHLKGIIHRDLKPSNLLITEQEGTATAKVIDFGIARATTGHLAQQSIHTMPGQIIGTLDYMSPEQADPGAVDIDTRSDVYSLGILLYELLSGQRPFELDISHETPWLALQRMIVEQEPPSPSSRLSQDTETTNRLAERHGKDGSSLIKQLCGDLDWICLKALEKDPARRYQSVSELANDLHRHLRDEPVLARAPALHYRISKFARRHRLAVAASVLITGSAILGAAGIVLGRLDALAAERVADASRPYSDAYLLAQLVKEADKKLWPPYPDKIQELKDWIIRAEALTASLDKIDDGPGHRADLRAMSANPELSVDYTSRHNALTNLVEALTQMQSDTTGLLGKTLDAASPEHGWSIPRRLAFAEQVQRGFAADGQYAQMWERYPEIPIPRQMGIVPIGQDPTTHLWEFAHLMTGSPPDRDAEEQIICTEKMPVILVLIEEDTFWMGAQKSDPNSPNFQKWTPRGSSPAHEVFLSTHFLSKFEMTQGQWLHLTGSDPSRYRPNKDNWEPLWLDSNRFPTAPWLHPVEQVSWWDCDKWLLRAGLRLPTEAEWEHGTRAGTSTAFSSPRENEPLKGLANVFDRYAREHGGREHDGRVARHDDGCTMHAPVGSYLPNGYGLHDVHGNVYEWCRDGYDIDYYTRSPISDPEAEGKGEEPRIYRGGSYRVSPGAAGSPNRAYFPPGMKGHALGVRPAATLISR